MNRRERRAAVASSKENREMTSPDISVAAAFRAYESRRLEEAEVISKQILANAPSHRESLMLLGAIYQSTRRHRLAIKQFLMAIALNSFDAICHYNIACSYQILGEFKPARDHFARAIRLGIGVEEFIAHNPIVLNCVRRIREPHTSSIGKVVIGPNEIISIANDLFLQCALRLKLVRSVELELFLTQLRQALLSLVINAPSTITEHVARLSCALAEQCFINEYVFTQTTEESQLAEQLRKLLIQKMATDEKISVPILSVVAAYFPSTSFPRPKSSVRRSGRNGRRI